jgi:RNA polymerase sigma-70 factor (ECF subfamily)
MYSARRFREHPRVTPELLPEVLADHLDRLYRAAWALSGSREDAEDLVQETFARVLAKQRIIASDEDALPYLLTVLRNTFRSSLRTRSRRPRTAVMEEGAEERFAAPSSTGPQAIVEARAVFAAIAALPDDQRDVIAAVDVAGLSYAEAAESLDVPAGTVMSRLHRGRSRVAAAVAA